MASKRSTVYVAGLPTAVNEDQLLETFVTFGDILEISMPTEPHEPSKHRGYAFITFAEPADAQEAIDNYDLNELPAYRGQGKFLKCSMAQPNKFGGDGTGKQDKALWESEEWIKEHGQAKELDPATDPAMQALQNGE